MVRRTRRFRIPPIDHAGLFVEATKRAARRAAWPDAYREGTGLLVTLNRTKDAQERLARAMSGAVSAAAAKGVANDLSRATQQARTQALHSHHGDFWTCALQDAPPEHVMDGDEYYSPQDVREIEHNMHSPQAFVNPLNDAIPRLNVVLHVFEVAAVYRENRAV